MRMRCPITQLHIEFEPNLDWSADHPTSQEGFDYFEAFAGMVVMPKEDLLL